MSPPDDGAYAIAPLPDGRPAGRFALLAEAGIPHAVSTRATMDVQAVRRAPAAAADEWARSMGLIGAAAARQVHGGAVLVAREPGCPGQADGLVTDVPGLAVAGVSADCPLILLADSAGRVAGMAHASWRSTVRGIARAVVAEIVALAGVAPAELIACIAPSASPDNYEVGPEVRDEAILRLGPGAGGFFPRREGQLYFDLWAANVAQLTEAGLSPKRIGVAGVCTIANHDEYPSYRAEGDRAGRFVALVAACDGMAKRNEA